MSLKKTKGYQSGDALAAEVIAALKKSPRGVRKPVPLIFYLYVTSKKLAEVAGATARSAGMQAEVERAASGSLKWLCLAKTTVVPEKKKLSMIGDLLVKVAKDLQGEFDGWETEVPAITFDLEAILGKLSKK